MRRNLRRRRPRGDPFLDEHGQFPAERVAIVSLRCRKCGSQVVQANKSLPSTPYGRELCFDLGTLWGQIYAAGPEDDPARRYAFDCGHCGTADQRITRARIEAEVDSVAAQCADGVGQTRVVEL
ncbi:MAG: hypothetical protein M3070_05510 [Actinomycetota bacterium]|nr:hypothetical protein [Actinomycetota bacterium]